MYAHAEETATTIKAGCPRTESRDPSSAPERRLYCHLALCFSFENGFAATDGFCDTPACIQRRRCASVQLPPGMCNNASAGKTIYCRLDQLPARTGPFSNSSINQQNGCVEAAYTATMSRRNDFHRNALVQLFAHIRRPNSIQQMLLPATSPRLHVLA